MFVIFEENEVILKTNDKEYAHRVVQDFRAAGYDWYTIEMSAEELKDLTKFIFEEKLLTYGDIKADLPTVEKDGYRRIRVIDFEGKKYFHHMFNGKVVEIFEV